MSLLFFKHKQNWTITFVSSWVLQGLWIRLAGDVSKLLIGSIFTGQVKPVCVCVCVCMCVCVPTRLVKTQEPRNIIRVTVQAWRYLKFNSVNYCGYILNIHSTTSVYEICRWWISQLCMVDLNCPLEVITLLPFLCNWRQNYIT